MNERDELRPVESRRRRGCLPAVGALAMSTLLVGCNSVSAEEGRDRTVSIPNTTLSLAPETHSEQSDQATTTPPELERSAEQLGADLQSLVTAFGEQQESQLRESGLNAERQSYTIDVGMVIHDWQTGETATYNDDEIFVSASLFKLFVAYGLLEKVDAGELSLDQVIEMDDKARAQSDVELTDEGITVGECLEAMITTSSNTCGWELGQLAEWATLDATLAQEGYPTTRIDAYRNGADYEHRFTSAADVATLLNRLYSDELLSPESTELFKRHLQNQQLDYALPTGLSGDAEIAHKTGLLDTEEWGNYSHDAGIVRYGDKQYTVVMLTGNWQGPLSETLEDSPAVFTELGHHLRQHIAEANEE